MIEATTPAGRTIARAPAEWLDFLPDPASLLDSGDGRVGGPVRTARVFAREAIGSSVVRWWGRYLNHVERYGPQREATLELHRDYLNCQPRDGQARRWPLEQLTAIQASSSTLQVKARGEPLVSFRFPDDSVFLWETLLQAAIREHYRRTGRGDVVEFQPRITTR